MNHSATLRQLQYFISVAEAGNFRRAAARLRVSQPTLSNQVAALEKGLSIQVLERSHAGSVLTPAGRDLLPSARRVVEEFQGFLDRAKSMSRGPAGTFRLGVTPTLGPYLLPYILPEIHRKYEALQFYVREDAPRYLEDDLAAGEHDLILVPLPVRAGDLRVAPLMREPVQLVLPADHHLAPTESVDPEDLRGEAVLTLQEPHHFHHQIDQLCKRLGAHVLRDYEGTSLDTLRQMVVMGMGIAFLPALYVRSEIHRPQDLCVTKIAGEQMERTHALVWRPSSPGDALFRRIANDIRGLVADLLPGEVSVLQDS
tara:strand:+ start:11827 stop:12765 length:939 start_codon:yes stop_codon:yes gene_type:complete